MSRAWIEAGNRGQLLLQLRRKNIAVPSHRTTDTRLVERHTAAHMLSSFQRSRRVRYPVRVVHRDQSQSPDFLLEVRGTRVGIEHTQSIGPNTAQTLTLLSRGEYPCVQWERHERPNARQRPSSELEEELRADKPDQDGWVGDEMEREWALCMAMSTVKKLKQLRKATYDRYDEDWLLIHNGLALVCPDYEEAASMLRSRLERCKVFAELSRIVLVSGSCICEVTRTRSCVLPINDLWQPPLDRQVQDVRTA